MFIFLIISIEFDLTNTLGKKSKHDISSTILNKSLKKCLKKYSMKKCDRAFYKIFYDYIIRSDYDNYDNYESSQEYNDYESSQEYDDYENSQEYNDYESSQEYNDYEYNQYSIVGISWNKGDDGPWSFGCDFFGNDLSNVESRGQDCSGKCKQTSGCSHYAWNGHKGGTCWMKQGSISQSNAIQASQDSVCGILDNAVGVISWNDGQDGPWAFNCDFFGNDLSNEPSNGEECSGRCKKKNDCSHYTWSKYKGGTCWMKKGLISKSNAKKVSDEFVCGIINTASSEPSSSGTDSSLITFIIFFIS